MTQGISRDVECNALRLVRDLDMHMWSNIHGYAAMGYTAARVRRRGKNIRKIYNLELNG